MSHDSEGPGATLREPVLSHCYRCHSEVVDGPLGGYCCGQCGHVIEPLPIVD